MSFLDKAKEKATQLTQQAKEKIDHLKDTRKTGHLIDELGRIAYRQRTERSEAGDEAAISDLIGRLQALEAEGTSVVGKKNDQQTTNLPPPAPMAPRQPSAP